MRCYDTCCQPEVEIAYRTLASRTVKAVRKPHRCDSCGREIAVGKPAWITVVLALEDRKCFSVYHHPGCDY